MSGQIFTLEASEHQAVQELLTWHANASLAPDEVLRVDRHLQDCAQCRHDLQAEQQLLAQLRSMPAHAADGTADDADEVADGAAADAALARLLPQLERDSAAMAPAGAPPATLPWWRQPAANGPHWLRWAALAQTVLIAALAVLLARPTTAPAYRALGAETAPEHGNAVIMFRPGTDEQTLRHLLQAHGARIVDGPGQNGTYVLNLPDSARTQALQALRADAAIQLAEPLSSEAAP